jgi:hypothetical protein
VSKATVFEIQIQINKIVASGAVSQRFKYHSRFLLRRMICICSEPPLTHLGVLVGAEVSGINSASGLISRNDITPFVPVENHF